ncbi:hypothetical protein KY314_03460 [Candidatus Woesearchaeota archaeon]|nr:hypothetical protein [Candidatus Woesearchaeota archaeon]
MEVDVMSEMLKLCKKLRLKDDGFLELIASNSEFLPAEFRYKADFILFFWLWGFPVELYKFVDLKRCLIMNL